jgi:hypothetical protein
MAFSVAALLPRSCAQTIEALSQVQGDVSYVYVSCPCNGHCWQIVPIVLWHLRALLYLLSMTSLYTLELGFLTTPLADLSKAACVVQSHGHRST